MHERDVTDPAPPPERGFGKRLHALYSSRYLPAVLICFGVMLRLAHYLSNRSLWIDEAMLTSSILRRSWGELLLPLSFPQCSAWGFVLVEKLMVAALGTSELVLRLQPFLAGVLGLYLFWRLAEKWLDRRAALLALALFGTVPRLLWYSAEVKHYSTDIIWTLILYLLVARVLANDVKLRGLMPLAVTGTVAIWFSFTSIFVLAGIGITLALVLLQRREWAGLGKVSAMGVAWVLSFSVCYLACMRPLAGSANLHEFWGWAFVPLDSFWGTAEWLRKSFIGVFEHTLGFPNSYNAHLVAGLAFLVGCYAMFRTDRRKLAVLVAPALLCLLAASLRKYPFGGRLLLFLAPGVVLLTGNGVARIAAAGRGRVVRVAALGLLAVLFIPTLYAAVDSALPPYGHEEIRPVIRYIGARRQPGDVVYVYWLAVPAFQYYHDVRGYDVGLWEEGSCPTGGRQDYVEQLEQLAARSDVRRIWFLISHDRAREREFFLSTLGGMGTEVDRFKARGSSTYLYDLGGHGEGATVRDNPHLLSVP
jgi:hypothetical protein